MMTAQVANHLLVTDTLGRNRAHVRGNALKCPNVGQSRDGTMVAITWRLQTRHAVPYSC